MNPSTPPNSDENDSSAAAAEWQDFYQNQRYGTASVTNDPIIGTPSFFNDNRFNETNARHYTSGGHGNHRRGRQNYSYTNNNDDAYFQLQNLQLATLTQFINDYNRNIREYQRNMADSLRFLRNMRMNYQNHQTFGTASSSFRPPSHHHSYVRQPSTTTNSNDTQLFFTYTLYPRNDVSARTLTTLDISQNTRTFEYTEQMATGSSDTSNNICPISLDAFSVGDTLCQIVGCGHVFKKPALMQWFRNHSSCPICRYNLMRPTTSGATTIDASNTVLDNDYFNEIARRLAEIITETSDSPV